MIKNANRRETKQIKANAELKVQRFPTETPNVERVCDQEGHHAADEVVHVEKSVSDGREKEASED